MLDNGDVWVTTDGGVNYSTDQFVSLNQYTASVNGLVGSDFWGFDQGWNEDIVVGGRYHNGNTGMADFYGDKALRMGGAESPTGWVLQENQGTWPLMTWAMAGFYPKSRRETGGQIYFQ